MAVSITDLTKPLVKAEVLTDVHKLLALVGLSTTAWQAGEPAPLILDVIVGWLVDKLWNPLVVPALRAVFLDYSTGDWLSLIAWAIYNRPRIVEQAATGTLTIENRSTSSGTVAVNAGAFRVRNKTTGKTYTNTIAFTLAQWSGSGAYPETDVTFEADEAGTGSNAQVSEIEAYPSAPVTSPSVGLYARTNASPFIGSDEESDANLVTRCRAAVGDLSAGGPLLAYVSAALDPVGAFTRRRGIDGVPLKAPTSWGTAAPAISRVRVIDTSDVTAWIGAALYAPPAVRSNGGRLYQCITSGTSAATGGPTGLGSNITDGTVHWKHIGAVAVYLASTSGAAGGDDITPDTDVFKANVAIQTFVAPPGITVKVLAAVPKTVALGTVTLYVSAASNVTAEEAVAAATADIDAFFSTLPIGGARKVSAPAGYVYANRVRGVFEAPAYIVDVDLTLNDTLLAAGEVAVPTYTIQASVVTQ